MKRALSPITLTLTLIAAVAFGGLCLASGMNGCRLKPNKRALEDTLRQDLLTMRVAIDTYTLDNDRPPQSLQDLVVGHYIRELPTDPFTNRTDWVAEIGSMELSPGLTAWGLYDIHSSSGQVGTNGRAYNTW